eukprot:CAMPEP_0202029498 /NCGR_PEP_ID=MMETSP0905-20130828/64010_1 /ASSEMBLY_ACC=CAM_ASM_000554 /TAXON_ID=420261 /ORGANISM="Thalassiosira antarctica, Strain CCMP982" /LENGTH=500 /DNA_ID=CAMNT_0048593261 /DNA_START=20 /DNA_END=1522 /DNA_ORIENTATION=-
MSAPKQRQGLLASVLLIILAITTFFLTQFKARQLRSFLGISTNYETLIKSVDLPHNIASRKSIKPYDRHSRGDGDGFNGRVRGSSRDLPLAQELFEGANDSDNGPMENLNGDDQISHADDEISGESHESKRNESSSLSQDAAGVDGESDDDETDVNVDDVYYEIDKGDDDRILGNLSSQIKNILRNNTKIIDKNDITESPACNPHFHLALPNNQWNNATKFRRIHFYHARKAGGSSMHKYLVKVAEHYGLELKAVEWNAMEEPGMHDDDVSTFYVTHLREPVDRSISHFKYQGRWNCNDLVFPGKSFTPVEDNAKKIKTWNQTGGHKPIKCRKGKKDTGGRYPVFSLAQCAVNCYTQWFSGLSCPEWGISLNQQYQVAKAKVLKYNFIAVIEKMRDPNYVQAVEDFFGVPGITEKGKPYCERQSHKANSNVPLIVRNDTRERLTKLNQVDIKLYHELSDCLDSGQYTFPKWDPNRFELHTYNITRAKAAEKRAKAGKNNG